MSGSRLLSLSTALLLALGLAGAAQAQRTSGSIGGEAKAGETVVVDGPATGFHRELPVEEDGKYTVRHVPAGDYTVVTLAADGTVVSSKTVTVQGGRTSRVK